METNRSINLQIRQNTYTVQFPNMGQLIDIESRKMLISDGKYGELVRTGTIAANQALNYTDMIAFFSVLIPDLSKDLRIENILKLSQFEAKELTKIFMQSFLPWYNEMQDLLNKDEEANA